MIKKINKKILKFYSLIIAGISSDRVGESHSVQITFPKNISEEIFADDIIHAPRKITNPDLEIDSLKDKVETISQDK